MDIYHFYTGQSFDAHHFLGAHRTAEGYVFRVFAPHTQRITLTGEFSEWEELELHRSYNEHFWEITVPHAKSGQRYLYRMYNPDGSYTGRPIGGGQPVQDADDL